MLPAPASFWLTPAADRDDLPAAECLRLWLGSGLWGFYRRNRTRSRIRHGDWLAFYASRRGVVAYARAAGSADALLGADQWPEPTTPRPDVYSIAITSVTWLRKPVPIPTVTHRLESFRGKAPQAVKNWAWLVNSTRRVSAADFLVLTGR